MVFNDEITGDGVARIWELTFYPICDQTVYKPIITKNTGTFASPVWSSLIENTDYQLNYKTGQVIFAVAPPLVLDTASEPTVSVKITAHHVKLNLAQFTQFWNEAIGQMKIMWPLKKYVKVSGPDIGKTD